jgi:hypothetical protein
MSCIACLDIVVLVTRHAQHLAQLTVVAAEPAAALTAPGLALQIRIYKSNKSDSSPGRPTAS